MKAVFDTRADTAYDDDITQRYHFPDKYLARVRQLIGDWIVYRETRRGGGRDIVQNGIALSATAHWLFDRRLISLTDDYGLLVSHNKVPAEFRVLFGSRVERICLPRDRALWPRLEYVRQHREAFATRGTASSME